MTIGLRAKATIALIAGGILLSACHHHPGNASDRPWHGGHAGRHHGPYGGIEGGGF